jgi:heptose II phosphotransferase
MLRKDIRNEFILHYKDGNIDYKTILDDFINYKLKILKVFRNEYKTKVMLIEHNQKRYVIKTFRPNGKKIEILYKSLFKKDYFLNLIERNDELWAKGMRFQNDIYLLAQRKRRPCTDLYIMILEYIPGKVLNEFDEVPKDIRREVVCKMALLHQHKLVSGDAHKGNFILSGQGLRIIDLSGKQFSRRRVAEDRLLLERRLKIDIAEKDFYYYLLIAKSIIRCKIKKVKKRVVKIPH